MLSSDTAKCGQSAPRSPLRQRRQVVAQKVSSKNFRHNQSFVVDGCFEYQTLIEKKGGQWGITCAGTDF